MGRKPRLQPTMVGLDSVVRILGGVMERCGHELADRSRQRSRFVGHDLVRYPVRANH